MTKVHNYNVWKTIICVGIMFFFTAACSTKSYAPTEIKTSQIAISDDLPQDKAIDSFIKPYRTHLQQQLDEVLCYNPENLEKNYGSTESNLGNLIAEISLVQSQKVFEKRALGKKIDFCLLNSGGIRAGLAKGDVTIRNAFEIMPFENNLTVLALSYETIKEMEAFLIQDKKPHPLAGIYFVTNSKDNTTTTYIQNKPISKDKTYYMVTSDYLANGGDDMDFLKKGSERLNLDYKIRNAMIDYFRAADTLKVDTEKRYKKVN